MKSKLPCCENNQKSSNAHWECSYCEYVFENADLRNAHNREIHPEQLATKRKMKCCDRRKSKRQALDHHQCRYCDCMFSNKTGCDYHMKRIHQCKCGATMLTDDDRVQHKAMHEEETRMEQLQEEREDQLELPRRRRQREMDDDFILVYVKANKLDEYKLPPDYKPDFHYVIGRHKYLEGDELVRLVKNYKKEFFLYIDLKYYRFGFDRIIDLAEKGAVSIEDIANILDFKIHWLICEGKVAFVSYMLDKNYKIKPYWVVNVIGDDELVRRINRSTHSRSTKYTLITGLT